MDMEMAMEVEVEMEMLKEQGYPNLRRTIVRGYIPVGWHGCRGHEVEGYSTGLGL